mgnify:CR=1 FL=1
MHCALYSYASGSTGKLKPQVRGLEYLQLVATRNPVPGPQNPDLGVCVGTMSRGNGLGRWATRPRNRPRPFGLLRELSN